MVFYPAFEIFLLPLDLYLNKKLGVWILFQMDIFGIRIHIKTYVDPDPDLHFLGCWIRIRMENNSWIQISKK